MYVRILLCSVSSFFLTCCECPYLQVSLLQGKTGQNGRLRPELVLFDTKLTPHKVQL